MLSSGSRERIGEEDGRVVEGGNDRLPHPPTRQSRLPQEIHDKFAGKSREVSYILCFLLFDVVGPILLQI